MKRTAGNIYLVVAFALVVAGADTGIAGVILDGTLGAGGALAGPDYLIQAEFGRQVGGNLFHSFSRFDIGRTESAVFRGPAAVGNIVSRVTGGVSSTIDGLLKSEIPGADFYFINPAGIMFGPNAKLDLGGSFHAGTADYIRLGDSGRFDAAFPSQSVLTVAPPSAFGFLGNGTKGVAVNGAILQAREGKGISFVGGSIAVDNGVLFAPSGTVNLVSLASAGEAVFEGRSLGISSGLPGSISVRDSRTESERPVYDFSPRGHLGNIDTSGKGGGGIFIRGGSFLSDNGYLYADTWEEGRGAGIDMRLADAVRAQNGSRITARSFGAGDGGTISIAAPLIAMGNGAMISSRTDASGNGGDITLRAKSLEISDSYINASTYGSGRGGDLTVQADESISIQGHFTDEMNQYAYSAGFYSDTAGKGNGGDVRLETGSLTLKEGGAISLFADGQGNSGSLTIDARDSVSVSGYTLLPTNLGTLRFSSGLQSYTGGSGAGADISVTAPAIFLDDHAQISSDASSAASGPSGSISLKASSLTIDNSAVISAWTSGSSDAGSISIDTGRLVMRDGGSILNESTWGDGHGGTIRIAASESVSLTGSDIRSSTMGSGEGGSIVAVTPALAMDGGASLSTTTSGSGNAGNITISGGSLRLRNESYMTTATFGDGQGGLLSIQAPSVSIEDGAYLSASSFSRGAGGTISIRGAALEMSGNGYMSANAAGTGSGGSIVLDLGALILKDGASIGSAATRNGNGGDIRITASDAVTISGYDSFLSASTGYYSGNGGSINLTTPALILDGGRITATSLGNGDAGHISLNLGSLSAQEFANVSVSSNGRGRGGTLEVNTSSFVDLSKNASLSCTARDGHGGAMVITTPHLVLDGLAYISSATSGSGNAGSVAVNVQTLWLKNGGRIYGDSRGKGQGGELTIMASDNVTVSGSFSHLSSNSRSYGDGGSIVVKTPVLVLADGGKISVYTSGGGEGGAVTISADNIYIANGSAIEAGSTGAGNAGNIIVTADLLGISERSAIRTSADKAAGGNIRITARDVILMHKSPLTASVSAGEGGGGNIAIAADVLVALDGSDITARADQGYGGNIVIDALSVFTTRDVDFDASSNVIGREGKVEVRTPVADIGGNLAVLPESLLDIDAFMPKPCAEREEEASSLVVRGRDGLPPHPEGLVAGL